MTWPDGWTAHDHTGRALSTNDRYRLTGNGVVADVARWIGERLP